MNDSYDECRSLYRAARTEEYSSHADRNAVRVGIAASLAAGVHTAAAGASVATATATNTVVGASALGTKGIVHLLLGGKFVSEVVIGVAVGTAVSATVFVVEKTNYPATAAVTERKQSPASLQSRVASEAPAKSRGVEGERAQESPLTVPQPPLEGAKLVVGAAPTVPRPPMATRDSVANATESPAPPAIQDRLVEETRALAQVQEALNRRDPYLAWSLLHEQERQFSSGQLGEERAAAKVMTLCAAGQTELANQARAGFLASYPSSPLAKRVKQGCDR